MRKITLVAIAILLLSSMFVFCQDQTAPPVVNININISRSVTAVNYQTNTSSRIDFKATPFLPFALGDAKVENKKGLISIEANFSKMSSPTQLGPEFLTYVLWGITPEGRATNLGELQLNGDKGKLSVTTRLPNFAMIVTAEPYFAVSRPSEIVVLQNVPNGNTKGATTPVTATLLSRSTYHEANLEPFIIDPKTPLAVYEARNALRIAKAQNAETYAPDAWSKASQSAAQMEDYLVRKQKNPIVTAARNVAQQSEDARSIAEKRAAEEKLAAEKRAADEKMAAEKSAAAEKMAQQQQEAAQREAELQAQQQAEAKRSAEATAKAAQEAQARAQAEAATKKANDEAEKSAAAAAQAVLAQQQLRAQLLAQLNSVLQTVDSPRGLVVTMADILFATGKYELSQDANLKLARLSGVILSHPGLKLRIEGYTDSTGTAAFNLTLSSQRADAVRSFLVTQGLQPGDVTSQGMGQDNPVADNTTAAGRKQNRRVEIIVSGEAIGTKIGQ